MLKLLLHLTQIQSWNPRTWNMDTFSTRQDKEIYSAEHYKIKLLLLGWKTDKQISTNNFEFRKNLDLLYVYFRFPDIKNKVAKYQFLFEHLMLVLMTFYQLLKVFVLFIIIIITTISSKLDSWDPCKDRTK